MRFPPVLICLALALVTAPPLSALQIGARLTGPRIKQIVINGPIQGGATATGTIVLTAPAQPAAGKLSVPVALTSSHPAIATVPAQVLFRPRATTQRFEVTTKPVAAPTQVTITGRASIAPTTAALVVNPPVLQSLACSPAELPPETLLKCEACLDGPSPGGLTVAFKGTPGNAFVSSSASRTIGANERCVKWSPSGAALPLSLTTTIEATQGGVTKTSQTKVLAQALASFSINDVANDAPVTGGNAAIGKIVLTAPAPAGLVVNLATTPALTLPSQVTIPAQQSTFTFQIPTSPVPNLAVGTVSVSTAFFGHQESKSVRLRIEVARLTAIEIPDPAALVNVPLGGRDVPATLRLGAGGGGMKVQLSSSNTRQATVPAEISIEGAAQWANFSIRVLPCSTASCSVSITASGPHVNHGPNKVIKELALTRQ